MRGVQSTIYSALVALLLIPAISSAKTVVAKSNYPCPTPPKLTTGFYVGAQAGYETYRVHNEEKFTLPLLDLLLSNVSTAFPANGFEAGVFAGYGDYVTNLFYLGIEGFANRNRASGSTLRFEPNLLSYYSKFNSFYTYGLTLVPGFRLTDSTLFYLKLGYNWSKLTSREVISTNIVFTTPQLKTSSHRLAGWHIGVGIETLLFPHISLRAEYKYTRHNGWDTDDFVAPLSDLFILRTTFGSSSTQFNLGLVYHFC